MATCNCDNCQGGSVQVPLFRWEHGDFPTHLPIYFYRYFKELNSFLNALSTSANGQLAKDIAVSGNGPIILTKTGVWYETCSCGCNCIVDNPLITLSGGILYSALTKTVSLPNISDTNYVLGNALSTQTDNGIFAPDYWQILSDINTRLGQLAPPNTLVTRKTQVFQSSSPATSGSYSSTIASGRYEIDWRVNVGGNNVGITTDISLVADGSTQNQTGFVSAGATTYFFTLNVVSTSSSFTASITSYTLNAGGYASYTPTSFGILNMYQFVDVTIG